ncbi:uncharacterized protein LOC127107522 [Lathyrus oleraceus]|uniref:uncharacterized protein LOC127107522 n=1 Tax=Pisum sativum TaxID=3888 RepID=UPI0021D340B6|nr:uncharacterized protein LOC127107522 [Pisum sativum]
MIVIDKYFQFKIFMMWSPNSSNSQLTPYHKFMSKAVVFPISEVKLLTDSLAFMHITLCVTVAKIDKLIESEYIWYKLQVDVLLCGSRCGINDPFEYPLALDKLLGKEFSFKVKWQVQWDNCFVVSILQETYVIEQLKAPWERDNYMLHLNTLYHNDICSIFSNIKESVGEANSIDDCEVIKELKITSKLNPDLVTPTTKRQNPDGSSESITLINLVDGELSSTKHNKLIKIEKL